MLGLVAGICIVLPLIWVLARRLKGSPAPLGDVILLRQSDGSLDVPVRGIEGRGRFGSRSRNSFRPSFHILPDGLRFRIIMESHLPFAEINKVTLTNGLFGNARLLFASRQRTFDVTLADMATARAVLRSLPAGLPLSEAAAALRNRVPEAANQKARLGQ